MAWFWIVLSALAGLGGLRYLVRLRAGRPPSQVPAVDDAALHEILRSGRLRGPDGDPPVDMRDAAEAEDEFWSQSWDEPEEYPR
ncbi:MAG: hypothetical protein KY467_02720 [Gemmatimonadetes bacterium]|nr:hypothetical protein [Gemmatimonadota bacterium]